MKQAQVAARIDARVKRAVDAACKARGIKLARFVEDALLDRLEDMIDREQVARLRREPTRPFEDVMRDLGLAGDL
jgi:uncharacterized protein (DUF1778 family)